MRYRADVISFYTAATANRHGNSFVEAGPHLGISWIVTRSPSCFFAISQRWLWWVKYSAWPTSAASPRRFMVAAARRSSDFSITSSPMNGNGLATSQTAGNRQGGAQDRAGNEFPWTSLLRRLSLRRLNESRSAGHQAIGLRCQINELAAGDRSECIRGSRRCCTDRVSSVNTGFCHDHGYA